MVEVMPTIDDGKERIQKILKRKKMSTSKKKSVAIKQRKVLIVPYMVHKTAIQ